MEKIIINGRKPLCGEVRVSGSKNAALPLIFASLLTKGISVFNNVPDIGDVRVALDLISELGAKFTFSDNRLTINTENLSYRPPSPSLVSKIRASTYLIGASLARFGIAEIGEFGGCNFSCRPIDLHIKSAVALSATYSEDRLTTKGLVGTKIYLEKQSVGATVNTLIMSAAADGETEIYGYAREPHVLALIDYLEKIGLSVNYTDEKITVRKRPPHPIEYNIIGDMIEAGSYITAAAMTNGEITVKGFNTEELSSFFEVINQMGYDLCIGKSSAHIYPKNRKARYEKITVTAAPYPSFPTDLQPIIAPLMAKNDGGKIIDTVWEDRFGYLSSLSSFGIESSRAQSGAEIKKSAIKPGISKATDLRGGMACILAALASDGESEILSPDIILRGYDSLEKKLSSIGADIKTVNL